MLKRLFCLICALSLCAVFAFSGCVGFEDEYEVNDFAFTLYLDYYQYDYPHEITVWAKDSNGKTLTDELEVSFAGGNPSSDISLKNGKWILNPNNGFTLSAAIVVKYGGNEILRVVRKMPKFEAAVGEEQTAHAKHNYRLLLATDEKNAKNKYCAKVALVCDCGKICVDYEHFSACIIGENGSSICNLTAENSIFSTVFDDYLYTEISDRVYPNKLKVGLQNGTFIFGKTAAVFSAIV